MRPFCRESVTFKEKIWKKRIAILIPCYNEEKSVSKVVEDFKHELPGADVYVFDNNSTDSTISVAEKAGAIIRRVSLQGKGNVICEMFRTVEADIYAMVDSNKSI